MADHDYYMRCPVCQAGLKIGTAAVIDGEMTIDPIPGPAQAHLAMHKNCTCRYTDPAGDRVSEYGCAQHGGEE